MFDFAVIIPTVLRPELLRASRSVIGQTVDASINLVVGIDYPLGDRAVLDEIGRLQRPGRRVTIVDPGYSTARARGGLYPNRHGGSLRSALSFLANARYLAYLDDDNWHAPEHLETLGAAIDGKAWAFSLRHYCDSRTGEPLAVDRIESVGPGRGVHAKRYGGFCNTSTLLLDTRASFEALPHWSQGVAQDGRGPDRSIFDALRSLPYGETNLATAYYWMQHSDINHESRLKWLRSLGLSPSTPMPFEAAIRQLKNDRMARDPSGEAPKSAGSALLAALLTQAKPERIILAQPADDDVSGFVRTTLQPLGVEPHILSIDPARTLEAAQFLRENEVLADFVYVSGGEPEALTDRLNALWVALKRNGVLLGAGYEPRRREIVAAADRFALDRAAQLVPCGAPRDRHFLIQRV